MRRMHTRPTFRISAPGEAQARWRVRLSGSATGFSWNGREDMASLQRKLGSTADRETKYDLGHDAAHQLVSATLKQTSNSAVVKDQRWSYDSIGNRTSEHDLTSSVTMDPGRLAGGSGDSLWLAEGREEREARASQYSHNNTNQLVTKKTYSSGQKPWVKGSLDEAGHVNLGSGPVAVKGDGSFEGQAPARTTTITAKDASGNVTSENWQLNSGSGATPDATFTYTHDTEGNLLGDGTSTFEWDLRNRLTAIVTGTHRTEFTYDGSDRRVRVVENESGTVTSDLRYIYHGLSLLEERAANNTTVLRRFYSGGHVDVAAGGTRYAYTTDHLGSIREVMQLDGTSGNPTTATLAARYDYDLWGKRSVLDGGSTAETLVIHGYTGHIRHAWSSMWLAPYRAYNTGLGRWISRDPIAEDGGINLYAYVDNNVIHLIDPLGLMSKDEALQGAIDFGRGFGDTLSFGLSAWLRDQIWCKDGEVLSPNAYLGGEVAGTALDMALGAALAKKAGAKIAKEGAKKIRPDIPGVCFVTGTLIATPSELRAIETLQVGERVTTTSGESTSVVDPATWKLIAVQMPNPECPSDILDIEMLRAPDWLDETGCEEGEEIWLELEEMGLYGWAEVRSIAACPPIQEGTGRVILATITHSNTFVMELKFEGQSETLNLTDRHSLFSITQNDWVPASQFEVGEELRTFTGSVRIESISELQSLFRVYNLEVEGDHSYLAGSAQVLSHNAGPGGGCGKPPFKKPKKGSGKEKADDVPSWAKGNRPRTDQNGKDFAEQLMNDKYGAGGWGKNHPEFNKLKKWGDRGFE